MRFSRLALCWGALSAVLCGPACHDHAPAPAPAPVAPAPALPLPPGGHGWKTVALVASEHDTPAEARKGLMAVLRLKAGLPLPYPRVERARDRYWVVAGRGTPADMAGPFAALGRAGAHPVIENGEGGDDVVRMGVICTGGEAVPLLASAPPRELRRRPPPEIAKLPQGEVVLMADRDSDAEDDVDEAELGYLRVLAPQAGLLRGPDVLVPADCTPRDEDNDDGNGRLLGGGRLCLTTRFSGREGEVNHAALVAVAPDYRRCTRFPEAGTFDGFDQSPAGDQFAVEAAVERVPGVSIYDVSPAGEMSLRAHLPGLSRPAYLGGALVAVEEGAAGQALVVIDGAALRGPKRAAAPRRIFEIPGPRFVPQAATQRPAAPTLHEDRVVATFQKPCDREQEAAVRARAGRRFRQCLLEVEVEAPLSGSGKDVKRRCLLDHAPASLDAPIEVPCR